MELNARGPVDYDLAGLTPERFESLTFLLARTESSAVVPVRNKDHGLDARLPAPGGRTSRGWQAKRYTDNINWSECRGSVRRALAFWHPPYITFCFPKDLSAIEQANFETELAAHFPEVRLDYWPGSELKRRIRDTDEGRRAAAWLFENPGAGREEMLRALAVGGELASPQQAAERQAVIQRYMNRDPHLNYTAVSRHPESAETPTAPGTAISVILGGGDTEVRFDAAPRYAGALDRLGLRLRFTEDEDGRRAQEELLRLAREGGRTTVSSGMGAVMDEIPPGLQGLMPEAGLWGEFEVVARDTPAEEPAPEFRQPVIVRAGEHELGVVLTAAEPRDGWDRLVRGGAGGLEIFFSLRRDGAVGLEPSMDWRFTRGRGSAREQLLATRVMLGALRGASIELFLPGIDEPMVVAAMNPPEDAEGWTEELEHFEVFLGYVAEIEAWIGRELDPPADPSEADAKNVAAVIAFVRQPESPMTWRRVELADVTAAPDGEGPWQFSILQPLRANLFGAEVFIGVEWIHLPEADFDAAGDRPALVPPRGEEEGTGTTRLHRPDELPPEAAVPTARA